MKDTNPKDAVGSSKFGISSVPIQVLTEVGNAMLEGQKYGRHNYRAAGVRPSVYIDALYRHVYQKWWENGEEMDPESQVHHLSKGIACLMVLRDSIMQGNLDDDRPPRGKVSPVVFQSQTDFILDKIKAIAAWTQKRWEPFTKKKFKDDGNEEAKSIFGVREKDIV